MKQSSNSRGAGRSTREPSSTAAEAGMPGVRNKSSWKYSRASSAPRSRVLSKVLVDISSSVRARSICDRARCTSSPRTSPYPSASAASVRACAQPAAPRIPAAGLTLGFGRGRGAMGRATRALKPVAAGLSKREKSKVSITCTEHETKTYLESSPKGSAIATEAMDPS